MECTTIQDGLAFAIAFLGLGISIALVFWVVSKWKI